MSKCKCNKEEKNKKCKDGCEIDYNNTVKGTTEIYQAPKKKGK